MSSPSTTLIVTNTGLSNIWAGGVQIAPDDAATFTATSTPGNITAVCADMNFWAAFLSGNCAVNLNGSGLPPTTPAVVAFLIAVAIGDINPT